MGRTRASAKAAAAAANAATASGSDGWEFRGAAKGDGELENYAYTLIDGVDPDVYDICIEFEVEDRKMRKLHSIMMNRADTFESDMLKLWDSVKNAREPGAILGAKMRDMERGTFIGKAPKRYYSERPLKDFFKRFDIDNLCKDSLADALYDRRLRIIRERKLRGGGKDGDGFPEKDMKEVIDKLSRDIEGSRNPSALVMKQVPGIETCSGPWENIGQVKKCKEAPVEEVRAVEVSKEELRVEDDRIAEISGLTMGFALVPQTALPKEPAKAPVPNPAKAPTKVRTAPAKTKKESKPSALPAFDSEELAKRLKANPSSAEIPPECKEADEAPSAKAPVAPLALVPPLSAPLPPAPAPPPEPIKRNLKPLKISKGFLDMVGKSGDVPKQPARAAPKTAGKDPAPASTGGSSDPAKMSDLEMASIALRRPIEELQKLPQDQVRAMVMAKLNSGGTSESSYSRSPSPSVEKFNNMSDLEMASKVLRRPVEELEKLPQEELRSLVLAKSQAPPSDHGSASRSPSPGSECDVGSSKFSQMSDLDMASAVLKKPVEELKKLPQEELRRMVQAKMSGSAGESPARSVSPAHRSRSRTASGRGSKQVDTKKRSRSNASLGKGLHAQRNGGLSKARSKSRSRNGDRRSTTRAEAKHRSQDDPVRRASRDRMPSKRPTRSERNSPRRADSRSRSAQQASRRRRVATRNPSPCSRKYESPERDRAGSHGRRSRRSISRSRSHTAHGGGRSSLRRRT